MKVCGKCKVPKTERDFWLNKKTGKLLNICRSCHNEATKQWKRDNPEKTRAMNATFRKHNKAYFEKWVRENKARYRAGIKRHGVKMRRAALVHYGGNPPRCACCGESGYEFLTIDHRNGDGAAHRKRAKLSSSGMWYWLKKHKYPEGFQVLCYNCNCAKRTGPCCPHKKRLGVWFWEI